MIELSNANTVIQSVVSHAISFALHNNHNLNITEKAILFSIVCHTEAVPIASVIVHECGDRKIQAIKEYRRQTGANLKDAKRAIENAMAHKSGS